MRAPGCLGSRTPGCSPAMARSSTTSCGPACCTPASCAARSPGHHQRHRHLGGAGAARCARGVHRRRPQPGGQGGLARGRGQGHPRHPPPAAGRGRGEVRRRPGRARHRREPRTSPRTPSNSSTSTTSRCPPSPTSPRPQSSDVPSCTSAYPDNVAGGMAGAPPDEEMFFAAPRTSSTRPSTNRCTCRCRWRPAGMVVEWTAVHRRAHVWASTQTPHELRAFCARLLGHARHTGAGHHARHRRRLRPEGRPDARGHVHHAGRPQGARAR